MRLDRTFKAIDPYNYEPAISRPYKRHSENSYNKSAVKNSLVDQVSGEVALILYTITDAIYSARTNRDYSERFDDVLWLTESERENAKGYSLQFYCELIGISFRRIQDAILSVLCDPSLLDKNARVNITYRSFDNSKASHKVLQ